MQKLMTSKFIRKKPGHLLLIAVVLVAAGLLSNLAQAQTSEVQGFSLRSAQEYAIEHSYDIVRSEMDIQAAKKKVRETVSTGFPQLRSSIDYMNNLELATVLIPNIFEGKFDELIPVQFGTRHNVTAGFTLSQLIFSGSYFVGLQTSKTFRQLADQNYARTQLEILETVTDTYYLILVSEESERILSSNLANLEKTHYEIRERYKEGFVAETDADLVQISVTKLKNSLQAVARQKEVAFKLLKFQMGLELDAQIALTDKLEDVLQQIDISKATNAEFDLEHNIDYKLLQTQEKFSEMALKNERAQYFPTVSAFFAYQWSAFRQDFNILDFKERWFRTQVLGVNINIPLFTSGAQRAKVAQASIALKQARNARIQASQGLTVEAASVQSALDSAYENYTNTKENMGLAQRVYDVTLVKYNEGVASSMDLTQAHDKYLMAQSEFIQAMSGLLAAKNKLDRLNNNYDVIQVKGE